MTNKEYWSSMSPVEHGTKFEEFMYNRDNMYNCKNCPYGDDGYSGPGIVGPCGQQHCWVWAHCRRLQQDDE